MQRRLALVTALVLLMVLPAAASAAKATRFTDHTVGISCEDPPALSGGGSVFFGANTSEEFEPDGHLDYWTTSEPSGEPDLLRDFEAPIVVTWDGSVLSGSIPLVDGNGDPAGAATFSASLVPVGDPEPFDEQFRDGNHQHAFTGVTQPMDPSGTLTVGSSTFTLDGCFADMTTVSVF